MYTGSPVYMGKTDPQAGQLSRRQKTSDADGLRCGVCCSRRSRGMGGVRYRQLRAFGERVRERDPTEKRQRYLRTGCGAVPVTERDRTMDPAFDLPILCADRS